MHQNNSQKSSGLSIEQLKAHLAAATDPQEKTDFANALAWQLADVNPRETVTLGRMAVGLAQGSAFGDEPYQLGVAQGALNIGAGYVRMAEYEAAMPFLTEALAAFTDLDDSEGLINATNIIGLIFLYVNDYASFTEYAFQALDLCRASGNRKQEATVLNNVGHGYLQQGRYEDALPYLQQSLALAEELEVLSAQGDAHDNLCVALREMTAYADALTHGRRSIALYEQCGNDIGLAEAWNNLGDVYLETGDLDRAIASFRQSGQIAEKAGHRFEAIEAQLRIGQTWHRQNRPDKVKKAGERALEQANIIASPALQYKSHYLLFLAAQSVGDWAEALTHYIQFHEIKETVFNRESDARRTALEAVHRVRQAQKEAEIYQLRSVDLEREIVNRKQIAAALQQQNEALNAFAQTVAHDLKSPIASMMGFAELLQADGANFSAEDMATIAESIYAGGQKVTQIVADLLLLAGVRSQQVTPEIVEMTAVTAEAVYQLQAEIKAKQATIIKPNIFPPALGYAPWIEQVWKNYISNGLKYGGEPPELEIGFTEITDEMIRFWVRDNGPGLTPAEQDSLFTEFTRLKHNKAQGHGLGLTIVRRIVEKLNGRTGVESAPGAGSLFYFDLPKG